MFRAFRWFALLALITAWPTVGAAQEYVRLARTPDISPDGKLVLFASMRSPTFPHNFDLYTIPVVGGMARRITHAEGKEGAFSPKGDRLAYVRGPGSWYRKGYRGSANDDIWICDAAG